MSIQAEHDSTPASTPARPKVYDVAIVSYGPAGVACANLLGHYGLGIVRPDHYVYASGDANTIPASALQCRVVVTTCA